MANDCNIKVPKKKLIPEKIISMITRQLLKKFKIKATGSFDAKEKFIEIKIKDLIFGCWVEDDGLSFYDSSDTALWRFQDKDSPYLSRPIMESTAGFFSLLLGYSYLHHYMINFLAQEFKTEVESGGAGPHPPFDNNHPRYESFEAWFNFMSQGLTSRSKIVEFLLLNKKKIEKFKKEELKYFPELKTP